MWESTIPAGGDRSASRSRRRGTHEGSGTFDRSEVDRSYLSGVLRMAAAGVEASPDRHEQERLDVARIVSGLLAFVHIGFWVRDYLNQTFGTLTAAIPVAVALGTAVALLSSYRRESVARSLHVLVLGLGSVLSGHMVLSAWLNGFAPESVLLMVLALAGVVATLPYALMGRLGMAIFVGLLVAGTAVALALTPTPATEPGLVLVVVVGLAGVGLATHSAWMHSQLQLAQSERHRRVIVNSAPIVLFAVDARATVLLLEGKGLARLETDRRQAIGRSLSEAFPDAPQLVSDCRRALHGEAFHSVAAIGRRYFEVWYAPVVEPVANARVSAVIGVAFDVTERRRAEQMLREREAELRHRAFHDPLTGLPNRDMFIERLDHCIRRLERNRDKYAAVLFLDLDRFKTINDSLGHHVGDELLVAIARRLEVCLRPADTVARLGGDEFTILLEDIDGVEDASRVAERIQTALAKPYHLNGHEVVTTVSIGIAAHMEGGKRPGELLRDADTAMYRAKAGGKARHQLFDQEMHDHAMRLLTMESDLRRALERDEFFVCYQPIVNLTSGRIIGFEALARWRHPERGLVSPFHFIPIAEETGLIVPLGEIILNRACEWLVEVTEHFPGREALVVHVNLSPHQFSRSDLPTVVDGVLSATGLAPEQLALEITETLLMENVESVLPTLEGLRERGIGLSIDDFGTGYSSLGYLHKFPIDTLKIDRSFVGSMHMGDQEKAIVETIATLARNLKVGVIAEGVETPEQLAALRELKCEAAQGYFFAKPLLPEDAILTLERNPRW